MFSSFSNDCKPIYSAKLWLVAGSCELYMRELQEFVSYRMQEEKPVSHKVKVSVAEAMARLSASKLRRALQLAKFLPALKKNVFPPYDNWPELNEES